MTQHYLDIFICILEWLKLAYEDSAIFVFFAYIVNLLFIAD